MVGGDVQLNTSPLDVVYSHSLIINPSPGMYKKIHPYSAIRIDSVPINTSLVMLRECILLWCAVFSGYLVLVVLHIGVQYFYMRGVRAQLAGSGYNKLLTASLLVLYSATTLPTLLQATCC